jgi:aspartate/methionine/tyrosine aminotransferase
MELEPFLLEHWLEGHAQSVAYNLGMSTGPKWTLRELLALMTADDQRRLYEEPLSYCPGVGHESLRAELATMYQASAEEIQIVTGASEALLALFYLAAETGANVIVPYPAFPAFYGLPRSLGLEVRRYALRHEDRFELDVAEIKKLVDKRTQLILINSPHNPTGALVAKNAVTELDAFAQQHGIQLVVDEVYHPIYQGEVARSAGEFSRATVLGDFSKAFSLSGLRVGWVLERNAARRKALANARGYFSISSSQPGEVLAEVATRHRETIFACARDVSSANLRLLDALMEQHPENLEWVRPRGGMTGFPRLRNAENSMTFCELAAEHVVLLAPGD